jgi:hypothetical protein
MATMNEDGVARTALPSSSAAAAGADGSFYRRRALPSEAEQERRREWGKKWGKLVGDAVREALKGSG